LKKPKGGGTGVGTKRGGSQLERGGEVNFSSWAPAHSVRKRSNRGLKKQTTLWRRRWGYLFFRKREKEPDGRGRGAGEEPDT